MTKRLATIACHECAEPAALRETKKGRLHYHCGHPGCGHQFFSRSEACDRRLAKRATAWTDTTRRAELGAGPKAAADPTPAPPAKPAPAAPPADASRPWWDRPLA